MSVRNMDVQDFIALNVKRRLAVTFGEDDPAPGMPWSAAFNDPIFILALEKVKPDEWNNSCNERCWTHLHIGSEEPNWSSSSVRSCPKAAVQTAWKSHIRQAAFGRGCVKTQN